MQAIVTGAVARRIPFTNEEGERWDLLSGPDIYYRCRNPSGEVVGTSDIATDISPSDLPVELPGTFSLHNFAGEHQIDLLESDVSGNQTLSTFSLRLEPKDEGQSETLRLQSERATLDLSLEWKQTLKGEGP